MKRFTLLILTLFLLFLNTSVQAAQNYTKKEIAAVSVDGFNIKGTLTYPKDKTKKEFKTVVLLHSLGYSSQWWENLPSLLLDKGYAVLAIDLRGHGASVYNSKLSKVSWKSLTNTAYSKYPDDVISVINKVKEENTKKVFFNDWAIIGSDIGASAGIIAADKIKNKPKTIVMLSPVVKTRNLYIPVSIAQLDNVDFLSISGANDSASLDAEKYLKKFAQKEFLTYTSTANSTGMVLLKNDTELSSIIAEWVSQYLK